MADKYKTLPIGTVFTYNGNKYKVCRCNKSNAHNCCSYCCFNSYCCSNIELRHIIGECFINNRTDNNEVYYEQINDKDNKDMNRNIIPTFKDDNALNDLHIDCPEGYSIDINNSDLSKGIIKFKKEINYIDVCISLNTPDKSIIVSDTNYKKIKAISRLMDIANYYNKGWKPDWNNNGEHKYSIGYGKRINQYTVNCSNLYKDNFISFKNESDAQDVIDNPNFRDILDTIYKD